MIRGLNLSAVKEEKRHLTKNIDKCYNNLSYYHIQTKIDLITKTQYLLQQKTYSLWTDGRRILTYDIGNTQDDKEEESMQLLKKKADMEIDDFPSHNRRNQEYVGKLELTKTVNRFIIAR
ncbi:hypothetical protein PVK06_035030 [Gossypium arboreum]|uniref:Uncharacterized protein n=1 Tax=Gossypium arboreum TaxID=29729 RepID=A0ABR0NFT1_GOSAR|nr:hypothetical protein PVK06_035030 [Gossypium arboreum]